MPERNRFGHCFEGLHMILLVTCFVGQSRIRRISSIDHYLFNIGYEVHVFQIISITSRQVLVFCLYLYH